MSFLICLSSLDVGCPSCSSPDNLSRILKISDFLCVLPSTVRSSNFDAKPCEQHVPAIEKIEIQKILIRIYQFLIMPFRLFASPANSTLANSGSVELTAFSIVFIV